MHANVFARDAISNAKMRSIVCPTQYPDLSTTLTTRRDIDSYPAFVRTMHRSFNDVWHDPLGYFQLKRFLYTVGQNSKMSFVEDCLAYKQMRSAARRAELCVEYRLRGLANAHTTTAATRHPP